MIKKNKKAKSGLFEALKAWEVNRLIVRPLARRIHRQKVACLKQGRRIIKKLQVVEESVGLVARELARRAKSGK